MSILVFLLLSVTIFCEEEVLYGTFTKANGNFVNNDYMSTHQISVNDFTYSSSGDFDGKPISNAFDDKNSNTYWVSKDSVNETSKPYILINFTEKISLEGFVIGLAYRTPAETRFFDGSPLRLNVYGSSDNNPFKLKYFFNGTYNTQKSEDWNEIQFVFAVPIECDSLKIEFLEVTNDQSFSKKYNAVARYLLLVEYINESINIPIKGTTGDYENEDYINDHKIPVSYFTYRSSGDKENHPVSNLFDDGPTTYWVSKDPNKDSFKNYIIINFQGSITLEGFLYDTSYRTSGQTRNFDGFPTKLRVYASSNDGPYQLVYIFNGKPVYPWTRIQFIFPEFVSCDKIKLEFTTVTYDSSFGGGLTACCGGLILLQHKSDEYQSTLDEINSIFTDYAQLTLNEAITQEKIEELKQKAMQYASYETDLKIIFERVEAIRKGAIKKDPHREFSTKPGSRNMLEQFGDSAGYCQNKLLLNSFGTNRQVVGIGGNTGNVITVYVDVEPVEGQPKSSVKLPTLTFTQIFGSWQSSFRTSNLKLGRNSFIFPDIQTSGYSVNVAKGGPIHISNPYTYETQGGHVNIYIEGGNIYPVFHRGDDENSFRIILENYYNRLNDPDDLEITVDAFEACSDHVITSCSCTLAYNVYIGEGFSPSKNIDKWDDFLGKLLSFGGVPFDKNDPLYNPMNDHVRQNFRTCQPYAGFFAFAWTEMIGLPDAGTHRHCVQLTVPGWAFAHEFGHTVDKKGRIWGENTNNMWAMYNIFMMNREIKDRIPITAVSRNLGPDLSDYVTHKDGLYQMDANPSVWWILEGGKPGYWADSENRFIYETSDRNENGDSIIGMTERFIYYATLGFGHNMSTYFERWGFCMAQDKIFNITNRWTYEKSTDNFKSLMNQAKEKGKFDEEVKKYWYVNLDQYEYLYDHDNKLTDNEHCYDTNEHITPKSITKNGESYIISLPEFKCQDTHLCYEVQSFINNQWIVLGVTYTQVFTDTYDYQGSKPKYRVYAYDRLLDHTGDPPDVFEPEEGQEPVCRIGETNYNTLNEAVEASEDGNTIILLRSFMLQPLNMNKRISIIPDESLEEPITITKINPGHLINVNSLGTNLNIQIGDSNRVKIIIDGGGSKQEGSIINVMGTKILHLNNVELRNNVNSNDGGALYIDYNSYVDMTNCLVEKCSSYKSGGAAYLCGGQQNYYHVELHINNVIFRGNSATQDGGAIDASGYKGYSRLISDSNAVFENNKAGGKGGAIYAIKYQQIVGAVFKGNQAQNGGAIYVICAGFEFRICSSNFSNNIATNKGTDIYLETGTLILNAGKFEGTIHKVTGSIIRFYKFGTNAAAVPDFTDSTFTLDLPNGGNVLVDIIGELYTPLIPAAIDSFIVENGFAIFENNTIIAYPSQSTITVTFNGQTYSLIVPYGDFVLPSTFEGFSDEYCITAWTKDGVKYNVGDTIFINQDCTFEVTTLKYCIIKIVYNNKEQTLNYIPNTYYYMPMKTPDNETVFGWECSDGNYYAYADPVLITTDLTFTAILVQKVTVTVKIGSNSDTHQLNYNEFFMLPTPPETIDGLSFKYYYSEGNVKYNPGDNVSIINDITIIAYYSNKITVSLIAGENEESFEYEQNDVITLPYPGPENPNKPNSGREFICWVIGNENYYPFSTYTVMDNVNAIGTYRFIDKNAEIIINYELPNVLSEDPHYVDGTITKTEKHSYLENVTFPGDEYYSKEPNGLGIDRNTSKKLVLDYWLINGVKYNGPQTIGVTEEINAVLVTKLYTPQPTDIPTLSPTEIPTISPTDIPILSPTECQSALPVENPTSEPIEVITPTIIPDVPFKTPEPLELEEIKPNGATIDTSNIPSDSNKEYFSKVTTENVEIIGNGSDNFYILIRNDNEIEITKTDAKFGVNLDSDNDNVAIKLNQQNANMNVKGSGTLTIAASEDVKNISINDVTVVHNKLNINVHQHVDSLEFNHLNLFGNAEFNSNDGHKEKQAKVKEVTVNEGATAKITNVQITEKVSVELNAALSLEKVNLEKVAEVVIAYQSSSQVKTPIIGKLGSPPIKISLIKSQSSLSAESLDEQTFTIASAIKDDFSQCSQWRDAVNIKGTIFNRVECKPVDNNMDLVASSTPVEEPKKKNITPIIIGVVVAVVVVIIIVVVVIIVVKRKHDLRSSDANILETCNDDEQI